MRPKKYSTQGIVISRRNFSEADRIITLLTKDYGKITVIAKNVRKTSSRKRGSLELFSLIKFYGYRTKAMDVMLEATTVDAFPEIRKDLKKVAVAYYFCDISDALVRDDDKSNDLFEFIREYFQKLATSKNLANFRKEFVRNILVLQGFWPENKQLKDPDKLLESILERKPSSQRVGKAVLT